MKRNKTSLTVAAVLVFCLGITSLLAVDQIEHPFVHPLFSDHAVLQRQVRVPVWGWALPGTKITVSFAGQTQVTTTGRDGKWLVRLNKMPAMAEPTDLTVTSSQQSVTIHDVLVGDVWLCSGQSNMEMGIGACNATTDIAQADFPQVRLLTVPRLIAKAPVESVECHWSPCSPITVLQGTWGGFSAAGFFFGRELYRELKIPIGLIHSSWGGTVAEAWTSPSGLRPLHDFDERLNAVSKENSEKPTDFAAEYENWCQARDPGTQQGWAKPECDTSNWKSVTMPRPFEQAGLPDFDGIVWFRRTIEVPNGWAGKKLKLSFGPIDDVDTTWMNGAKIGQMNRYDLNRVYSVPAEVVKPGANVISVRVLDTGGAGGFAGKPDQMFIQPAGAARDTAQSLAGEWQMRDSAPLSKLGAPPAVPDANNPNLVTVLYNGMIAPLLPFAIKGAIWYQGESNASRAEQYRRLLPAMIRDWRAHFGVGDFPFYIVQLAAFQPVAPDPRDSEWAELREAQALTAKTVGHCGLAVAIDIGDASDIHPKNKAEVGRRLALCALADTYRKEGESSGPWYKGMKKDGNRIRLSFNHVDGGLAAKGADLQGFAIAGEDRKFVWATAVIDGNTVVVSSPHITKPVAVRYAWDINPVCNLYNQAGLPAVPFRTDDWQMVTRGRK
ncbi:MAG TPA: sialate O-acetylesterase [Candidatus Limnocylindrales bacterium]|nr:sialate O-acetylesterase [Candidatus Limnocylindrales bacterium]